MDKQLLISLQTTKAYKFLEEANEMVNQKRWDLAANRYYYAVSTWYKLLLFLVGFLQKRMKAV